MQRARAIIAEIKIKRQGELKHFEIKLPKNSLRVIGIETDAKILSPYDVINETLPRTIKIPFLKWKQTNNPIMGKLKLQSLERAAIFYESWLPFVLFKGGIENMSYGLMMMAPYTLNKNSVPKKTDITTKTTLINGLFEDVNGKQQKRDIIYLIKVIVWVETEEETKNIVFDFQNH